MKKEKEGIFVFMACAVMVIAGVIMASTVFAQIYPEGMISYWKFDEGSGTIAYDSVGNNDGTVYGATWTDGICRKALSFDGAGDYVHVGPTPLVGNLSSFTIEIWFRITEPTGIEDSDGFYAEGNTLTSFPILWFGIAGVNRQLIFEVTGYGPYGMTIYSPNPVNDGEWHHGVAIKRNQDDWELFLDGASVMNSSTGVDPGTYDAVTIGAVIQGGVLHEVDGILDEVVLYDRALTPEEIQQRYQYGISCDVISVALDIKPGSDPNCFNNDGHGVIPVAILGSTDFDVTEIDASTVALESLTVAVRGKHIMAHIEDVNDDTIDDLVVQIEDEDGAFDPGDSEATVTGNLLPEFGGTPIEGTDSICVVP